MSRVMMTTALVGALAVSAGAATKPTKPAAPKAPAAAATPQAPAAPVATPSPAGPAVVVKDIEAVHALVVPMKGSYEKHGDAFGQLFTALGSQGVRPVGPPFGRYLNDSTQVAEADLLWEIGAPVAADTKAQAPLEVRDIAAGKFATLVYDGPQDGIGKAWQQVIEWMTANKYRPTAPPIIAFVGEPSPDGMKIELRMAVEKVQ